MEPALAREYDVIVLGLGASVAPPRTGRRSAARGYWGSSSSSLAMRAAVRTIVLGSFAYRISRRPTCRWQRRPIVAWASLEERCRQTVSIFRTGGLDIGPRESPGRISEHVKSMRACGVRSKSSMPPRSQALAVLAHRRRGSGSLSSPTQESSPPSARPMPSARGVGFGATLHDRTPVTSLRAEAGEIEVEAGGRRLPRRQTDRRRRCLDQRALAHSAAACRSR